MPKRFDFPLGGMPRKLARQRADREQAAHGRVDTRRGGRYANWSVAEVEATEGGLVLTVPIEGEPDADWDYSFRRAVEGHRHEVWHGYWRQIRHGPDHVRVEQLVEGSEATLRAFIDACVLEAEQHLREEEADRLEDEEVTEARRHTEASPGHEPTLGSQAAARRMTERFRQD